ncbi:MAG: hypothetical protein WBI41_05930 [Azovibrio sp.]|uniref:hypothetical protein n=1 Tax=Azovibrio sp. TaxID=1872673 RepID=UPI003C71D352
MNIYTHLIAAALSALSGFYIGNGLATGRCDAEKLAASQDYLAKVNDARAQEQAWQTKYQQGVEDARKREKQLAADAAAATAAATGLRHTIADLQSRLPTASAEACRDTADTSLTLFGECAAEVGSLAAAADGHASDAALCLAAWPE